MDLYTTPFVLYLLCDSSPSAAGAIFGHLPGPRHAGFAEFCPKTRADFLAELMDYFP